MWVLGAEVDHCFMALTALAAGLAACVAAMVKLAGDCSSLRRDVESIKKKDVRHD